MRDEPREYDREFTDARGGRARRRIGYSHTAGEVTRFVVHLEYDLGGEWATVVRFDHDPESDHGHDVEEEGVHMDVYRNGEKVRSEEVFPPAGRRGPDLRRRTLESPRTTLHREIRDMAQDQEPMTDAEHDELREAMEEQGEDLRAALAEDLGGDPEDYRVDERPVPDGGRD